MHCDCFEGMGKRLWLPYIDDVVHTKIVGRESPGSISMIRVMIVIVDVLSAHLLQPSSLDITAGCRDYTSAWKLRTFE